MPLTGAGLKDHGKKLRPDGVDFVDVAALVIGDNYFPLLTTIRIRFSGDGVQDPSA
jgi:hypothetical protein